jgi:hypothetical protein
MPKKKLIDTLHKFIRFFLMCDTVNDLSLRLPQRNNLGVCRQANSVSFHFEDENEFKNDDENDDFN